MHPNTNTAPEPQPQNTPSDIFSDVANLRVDPSMSGGPTVKKLLTVVPVKKPSKEWFVRTHPDTGKYCLDALVLELKEESEVYLIPPALRDALSTETCVHVKRLRLGVNRQGDLFIWPIRLPGVDGKSDPWNESALEAADRAATQWVRLASNRRLGAYETTVENISDAPRWPDMPFNELLRIAFKGRVIDTLDHPVLRRLRGEV